MRAYILVMAGGAVGAALRYALARALPLGTAWPWPTFIANVAGGVLMGLLSAWLLRAGQAEESLRLLLGVGLLGGFTTFSAFSLEMAKMMDQGQVSLAAGYALASVLLALVAVFAGMAMGRGVFG
jgi:fluoride exporter